MMSKIRTGWGASLGMTGLVWATALLALSCASPSSNTSEASTGTTTTTTSTSGTTYTAPTDLKRFNLIGFAQYDGVTGTATGCNTTGGGVIATTDPTYAKVTTVHQFLDAVYSAQKGKGQGYYASSTAGIKVIEIAADLSLGYTEAISADTSGTGLLTSAEAPKLHPTLLTTGVGVVKISPKNGLTIFSKSGNTIKHGVFNIKQTSNVMIRNLKFDELWEWDEVSKGDYDKNDWDFIDLSNGAAVTNVWIDHCTFTKAYDGTVDMKAGTGNVTMSWNRYTGDEGATNRNSWVRRQFDALETNSSATFYHFLRNNGLSEDDLVTINQGHDKTHLLGATEQDSENATFRVTMHHEWYQNVWDRNPARLRGGDVHVFNNWVDDDLGLVARRLRDARVAAMTAASQLTFGNYSMGVFLNGSIATEGGAMLVEKSIYSDCLYPLRNNQTDVTNPSYTGKILALDTVYHFDKTDGSVVDLCGDSNDTSVFPAVNSNGTGVMGPAQAAVVPFSWTGFTSLPYSYYEHDPASLKAILQAEAGAGAVNLTETQWMTTQY